ncbi:MAG: tetratricopeptide repeat protein [Bacteroidales bacterium]|nr:tetratricopeptide repeat protein [Bacteroidales bacterium]
MYKSSKYFENIKDTFNQSFCIKEIGVYYRNLKNYKEAINNYNRAIALLKLYKDEDNWYMKIIYYQGLSRIYLEMQQPDSAYPILQDANLLAKNIMIQL